MKHIVYFTVTLVFLVLSAIDGHAQTAQAAFDRANEHIQNNRFQKAIQAYQTIYDTGYSSGPLCLNMAIAYIELDSLGMAKSWLLEAEKFEDTQEDALNALTFVEGKFGRRAAVLPALPWERLLDWQIQQFGISGISLIAGFSLLLPVIFLLLAWFLPPEFRKVFRYTAIVFSVIGLIGLINLGYAYHVENTYKKAISISKEHDVLSGFDINASVLSLAYEGYLFRVNQKKSANIDGWSYVRMSNGTNGWVRNEDIRIIP